MIENLDKIKAAIEIETKYRYIDIHGKTQKFSSIREMLELAQSQAGNQDA